MIKQRCHRLAFSPMALSIGILFVLAYDHAIPDELDVFISPSNPKQGDTLVISVSPPVFSNATIQFRGRSHMLFRVGESLRTMIGTSPDTPPGKHTLLINTEGGQFRREITLGRGGFSIQRLTLPASKNRLRKDPRIPDDKKAIREAFARQTDEKMWRGPFTWPVKGAIRTQYGLKRIVNGDANYGWHKGYDLRGKAGTSVKAPAGGVVSLVRKCILEGDTVILDHGYGVSTIYMHLSVFTVRDGDRVRPGQVIGRIGNTGLSSGPHLHWGVYVGGVAVNPKYWLTHAAI